MASTPSRLAELSNTVSKNTVILDQYLRDNNIPKPTFDAHDPIWDAEFPPDIQKARIALQDASTELIDLTTGSRRYLSKALNGGVTSMDTLYHLDIPHKVPLDDPEGITYQELCAKLDIPVNEYALTRILRAAVVHRIFKEPSPGRIAHSAASRLLATDALLFDWLGAAIDVMAPKQYIGQAITQFPALDEANRSAASLTFPKRDGEYVSFYEYIAQDPERAKQFGRGMSSFQTGDGYSPRHLVDGFDWGSLPEGSLVVDVGGSHGDVDMAIARKSPHLRFLVQDLPETIASTGKARKIVHDENLNIEFVVHDFLTPQTVKGVKIFILRWILHNWPDQYCRQILQSLLPAMVPGSRVLVFDGVMPGLGTLPNVVERDLRVFDLTMLGCFNAGDREVERYRGLLEGVGLRFGGCWRPEGSRLSCIVGEWEG
ncbi:hypothetical protein M409DRAFT_68278 [Zasmidium cellare ATCC 36951]|uniref:O-methyltransferase C-terminal domain-containing protein n=1 Tax=Zasmidium cellare ATCC 36951 TaxID=1080233 RepID=A0A6A6CCN1_ZASCE|nr:uncharacterized protein M409DRAFT_68278 [Zasmidium cellare ATCC 36951]KAF2163672.1 hypothetical protein M409DRAFT_68278 [Zasmidium cellare ATCC 36951]